jgi:proteasome-associated ATPase
MSMTDKEIAVVNNAREKITEQQNLLKRLTAAAYHVGVVTAVLDKSVIVVTANQVFELDQVESSIPVKVGMSVDVHPETGQIVRVSDYTTYGVSGTVVQIDDKTIQLNTPSGILATDYATVPVEIGDHVIMDSTNHVIIKKINQTSKFAFKTNAVLTWDDIGACEDAKKAIIAALETPYVKKDIFKYFHKKEVKGALLWGRAGNGKTLIGRAAAGSLARMHSKESVESGFVYIKGPEILDKYVGESESQIRLAFDFCKRHYKKYGYPAILFIDEADAILMRRGSRTSAGMEQTIVPQFLSEMDGIEDSGTFVLLATNRADTLDPAVIRPGRIDRPVYVAPPTKENAPSIWNIHMRNVPLSKGVSSEELIKTTNERLFSEQYPLYKLETTIGTRVFSLGSLVSGALIAGIVERASAVAIDRNNDAKNIDGLCQKDFDIALTAMHKEQYGMNHMDELREFVENQKLQVTAMEQYHNGVKIDVRSPSSPTAQLVAVPIPSSKQRYDS